MKYLKSFNEVVNYSDEYGEYNIEKVTRDNRHEYEYCDGILYELSGSGNEEVVYVDEVEHTDENTFYDNQIGSYVDYLNDDGILQTFPVDKTYKYDHLGELIEELTNDSDFGVDFVFDLFKDKNKTMYDLYFSAYGFGVFDLDIEDYFDGIDNIYQVTHIKDIDDYFSYDEESEDYNDIKNGLKEMMKYIENEYIYHLKDFNHRFSAVKRLGKERVYVDIM